MSRAPVNLANYPELITFDQSGDGFFLTQSLPDGTADPESVDFPEEWYREAARRWNIYRERELSLDSVVLLCERLGKALEEEKGEYDFGGSEDESGGLEPGCPDFDRLKALLDEVRRAAL